MVTMPLFSVPNLGVLLQNLQFLHASGTDILVSEHSNVLGAVAKNAAGLILFQNDRGSFHIDFQRILLRDVQCAPHFDGEYDPAQLVYFSYDTC